MTDKDKLVGSVSHYYDKIGVAVVDLSAGLKTGDEIKIVKGDSEFTQTVESIQIEKKSLDSAKKGDSIGLKVNQPVRPGAQVYLVS